VITKDPNTPANASLHTCLVALCPGFGRRRRKRRRYLFGSNSI